MDFIRRAAWLALGVGLAMAPIVWWLFGVRAAVGVVAGLGWAVGNMWVLARLICSSVVSVVVFTRPRRRVRVSLWLLKGPVLYALGAWLVVSRWSSPLGFLIGFSMWFVLLIVGALIPRAA